MTASIGIERKVTAMNTFDSDRIKAFPTKAGSESGTGSSGNAQDVARGSLATMTRSALISRLGLVATSIVHEINQPLSSIRINGETGLRWLDGKNPDVARARILIEGMIRDANRALDIIDLLKTIGTGRAAQRTQLTADEIVADPIKSLQHELKFYNIQTTYRSTKPAPAIGGNRLQLQQVVINLITNAVHALAVSATDSRKIAVDAKELDGNVVRFTIEDSGPGIDAPHFPRLFEDVFTTKPAGMGMGLLICRSIVEAHGGDICADNESSLGGARFTFRLPALFERPSVQS